MTTHGDGGEPRGVRGAGDGGGVMAWHEGIPLDYRDAIVTGDARELSRALPDASVDLVLTDPPFGIDFKYEGYEDDKAGYHDLVRWIVAESTRVLKPGGLAFVFQAQLRLRLTWPLFPDDSRLFMAAKNFVQFRPAIVQFAYDPVVFWQKPGASLVKPRAGSRDWHIGNTANTNDKSIARAGWHECPRPLDTCQYLVECFSPPGGVVCDWFMGSGTTAIAARVLGRHFVGFELRDFIAAKARERVLNTQPPLAGLVVEQPDMFDSEAA